MFAMFFVEAGTPPATPLVAVDAVAIRMLAHSIVSLRGRFDVPVTKFFGNSLLGPSPRCRVASQVPLVAYLQFYATRLKMQ